MSWDDYIKSLVDGCTIQDAVICGFSPSPSVWACHPGGSLGKISPTEIKALAADDRSPLCINGVTVGGLRCSLIRDQFSQPDSCMMDIKTKATEGPTYNIAIYKCNTAFVIVMGAEGVYGGTVHSKAHCMGKYLRDLSI